ncbi:hypothetical protein PGIGA_G00000190 [Pangasianodon gigas]|uniref:Uncharacterized protein n=1 Tax=Pangasianodon gigas TaxID=30993 RepID=A0ACC5W488_PANGG|nr:hypothetical protein [Pangasianodon gigas]
MAEQTAHTGGTEQEVETLSVDDYQKLLNIMTIKLPKGVLTPEVITKSTHPNVIKDAISIKQELENCTLRIAMIPRLACGKIQQALQLKEKGNAEEITKMIFFRKFEDSKKETLMKHWEKKAQAGCGFQMKDTYKETSGLEYDTDVRNVSYGTYDENQKNAMDCFEFYQGQMGLTPDDVNYKTNGKQEFEFLSGKLNFLVDIKRSSEDISLAEKIIIKCNTATRDMAEEIFTLAKKGFQAEFNTSHQYYLQAQSYLYILKEKERMEANPVPVRAVIVMKIKPSEDFYWSEVSEDTEKIKQLNNFCKNEALPRFLAVLNLVFEKEN